MGQSGDLPMYDASRQGRCCWLLMLGATLLLELGGVRLSPPPPALSVLLPSALPPAPSLQFFPARSFMHTHITSARHTACAHRGWCSLHVRQTCCGGFQTRCVDMPTATLTSRNTPGKGMITGHSLAIEWILHIT